jgi:hypothetical protein
MLNVSAQSFDDREFLQVTVTIVDLLAISVIPREGVIFLSGLAGGKRCYFLRR